MVLLVTGFATFFVVQLVKFLATPKLTGEGVWKAVAKMVLAGATAFGTALLVLPEGHWKAAVAYGLAGAGLAVVIHKSTRLISSLGDESFTRFLQNFR
jgi:hypothetical protein